MTKKDQKEVKNPLLVFCYETVEVRDKVTFFSYLHRGLLITHWTDDVEDEEKRMVDMFTILFEEVEKIRKGEVITN